MCWKSDIRWRELALVMPCAHDVAMHLLSSTGMPFMCLKTCAQLVDVMQAFADRAGKKAAVSKEPFASSISNFYQTDVISRSSQTMAKCVQARGL